MAALIADIPNFSSLPGNSEERRTVVDTEVVYRHAIVSIIGAAHASAATIGGQARPYSAVAGEIPVGRSKGPSGNKPKYESGKGGSVTGNTTDIENLLINNQARIVEKLVVAGASDESSIGAAVYLVGNDQDLTLTKGTPASLGGTAWGYIQDFDGVTFSVYEYSAKDFYQNLIEEGVIA